MIFARRALQRRLDELRPLLGAAPTTALAARLNRPGKDRMATMWEIVILHGLSKLGSLKNEIPLSSGRRPDISFDNGAVTFTADITAVSDDGIEDQNPYEELSELIEAAKTRLGLAIGGMDLVVGSKRERNARGTRVFLHLPPRKRLREFVRNEIEPRLREQLAAGKTVLQLEIEDETVDLRITIDPDKSPYSSGSFASYNVPAIKDRNPLYNALRPKAAQLRGAPGLVGIIVGDGDSNTLAERNLSSRDVDAHAIADEFLRQNSSIDFIVLLSVREEQWAWYHAKPPHRELHALLAVSKTKVIPPDLEDVVRAMMAEMPKPIAMPINAARRAREAGYGWGHHGGHQMSAKRIKIGAREIIEILAGRRTVEDMNASHNWVAPDARPQPNAMPNPFALHLQRGQLPVQISVIKTDENGYDDWIEIEFGDPDPAISPFR